MKRIKNYSGFRRLIIDISIEFEIQFIVYWIDIYIFIPDKMAQITYAERISVGGRKGHRREFQRVSRYQEPPSVIQPDVIPYSNIPLCCRARAPHSKSQFAHIASEDFISWRHASLQKTIYICTMIHWQPRDQVQRECQSIQWVYIVSNRIQISLEIKIFRSIFFFFFFF